MLPYETKEISLLYNQIKNWKEVEQKVLEDNLLQRNSLSTRKRVFSELKKRINNFNEDELKYFNTASMEDVKVLSFIGCLKTYRFIYEFVIEVIREKFLIFDYQLEPCDYTSFLESKMALSKKLSSVSETTQKKLRQVLYNILAEVGLIENIKNPYITKPLLSESIIKLLINDDEKLLKALLLNDSEIEYYKAEKNEDRKS